MSEKPDLLVAPCSYQAAKYAVEKWHYSGRMPKSKLVKFGVWENGEFVGAIIYGLGGTPMMGKAEGLPAGQTCELVRVALSQHQAPTSRPVGQSLILLKRGNPGLRLVVSFADSAQDHIGVLYQATNWIYVGGREETNGAYRIGNTIYHPRTLHHMYGKGGQSIPWLRANIDPYAERIKTPIKYKYLYPLDRAMRRQIAPLAQPYPKRETRPVNGDTPAPSEAGRFNSEPDAHAIEPELGS